MYSPKIKEELVRKLYKMKHSAAVRIPMTKLVNKAVEEFLNNQKDNYDERNTESNIRSNSGGNNKNILQSL